MKKLMFILAAMLITSTSFGVATDGDHRFTWGQWTLETINDWVKVGSAGYEQYFDLVSLVDTPNNTASALGLETNLRINVPNTKTVPAGTWAGYEWTVPDLTQEAVIQWYTNGNKNISAGTEMRLVNGQGDILWSLSPNGFFQKTSEVFSPTDTVRLIMYKTTTSTLYSGQFGYSQIMTLYTQDVPEPATMSILALGIAILSNIKRKK